MSLTLVQLTAEIVSSHVTGAQMSSDDLVQEINKVFSTLKRLEAGEVVAGAGETPAGPALTFKQAFKNDQVGCMICGKTGFKTLTRHLKQTHDMKPGQYRKQFNIPSSQSLTAKSYSEARRKAATENNLAANLEKARAVRAAKKAPVVAAGAGGSVVTEPNAVIMPPVVDGEKGKAGKAKKPAVTAKPVKAPKSSVKAKVVKE